MRMPASDTKRLQAHFMDTKNHLAMMTEERLIAGIHVTSGGAPDGQQLPELIEKSKKNGIEVYSSWGIWHMSVKKILTHAGEEIALIARTNSAVAAAANAGLAEGFCF